MAALFFGSGSQAPGGGVSVPDWLTHGIAYLVLAVLLARAFSGGRGPLTARIAVLTVVLCTLYGITDEYHQSFIPRRDASVGDVAKDLGGSLVGVFAYWALLRGRTPRRPGDGEPT